MKKPKKNIKPVASNNKKEGTRSKQMLNKSMEKKKKVGISLTTEPNKNSTIEVKNAKDKISIVKPIKKDKGGNHNKSSSMTNRSAKSTKSKEYDNKLNEDHDYEIEKTKEYDFFSYKEKPKPKTTKPNEDDNSEEGGKEKGDFLYRTMYKTNADSNKGSNLDNLKTPDTQKVKKDIDITKPKEKPVEQPPGAQFAISMERTDDITYDIGDKKIHSNIKKSYQYNNYKTNNDKSDYKVESEDSTAQKYSDNQNKKNNYNSGYSYDRPSTSTYSSKTPGNFIDERTIDLYVIDTDGEEPVVSTRNKKRIDRTRNKIKEVKIEKYDAKTPIRDEKLTGFVLIRKSKGKRIYDVEFEDDFDKINEILKNKRVMIKNEIIQFTTVTKLSNYERDIKNYTDKISRLQNDLNKKDYSKNSSNNDDKYRDYEKQISTLKSKNEELNKKAYQLQDELDENIREFKQVKLAYDQLKDSIEREKLEREKMEKEKKEKEQVVKEEPSKIKKKAAQMQQDENNDQKAIKEMKLRIKKYKDVLRNPDEKNKIPFTYRQDDPSKGNISPTKKRHKANADVPENKDSQVQDTQPAEEEDDDIGEYVLGDEDAKDPRKRKMKNAVNRFRNKYKEVIKEEKKAQREKEKEEKEREENEEKELEDDNDQEEKERQEREREELERQERERKEREEREERERKEREERERREREERERREREEKERKEREERERKERERKERERKEKEERERKERERKEKEKRDREEKERKEREKKEKEKKDNKPAMGGARMGGGKMGGNFAKMLADKLKMAPPGMKKGAGGAKRESISKPPVIEKNVDMTKLLEEQPFQGRKDKKKPTRKVFVIEDDDE